MATGIKITGQQQMAARLRSLGARFGSKVAGALYRRAELVMGRSKSEFVPVDFATLKNSGTVHPPEISGGRISVSLTYGGAASAYALAIHEHPSGHSPPSWRGKPVVFSPAGTGPKYLERPLMEAVRTLPADLASDLALDKV